MSLMRCPECDTLVSSRAPACPGCGFPCAGPRRPGVELSREGVALSVAFSKDGRRREYQLVIGAGSRSRPQPARREKAFNARICKGCGRRKPSLGKKSLVVMAALFCVFFGSRFAWSLVAPGENYPLAVIETDSSLLPAPVPPKSWENSLKMKFIRVGNVLLAVQKTRVSDYSAFVQSAGHSAGNGWSQTDISQPVVAVSWEDAMAFCQWLTEQERQKGSLKPNQFYRLPRDSEWRLAAGLAGDSDGDFFPSRVPFHSAWKMKAPRSGVQELGGTVWEWCLDAYGENPQYRVVRGGSWQSGSPGLLPPSYRGLGCVSRRTVDRGFRCVLETRPVETVSLAF